MDPLDNPIWSALVTRQAHLARRQAGAAAFAPEVSILAGVESETTASFAALAALLAPGELVGSFLCEVPDVPSLAVESAVPLVQMVRDPRSSPPALSVVEIVPLGAFDVPEMIALTARTKPGPFNARTREMGDYFGIRREGELIAMAGERLHVDGHTELSAICTDVRHLGCGYAAALMAFFIARIEARGERAFLHVLPENKRAIALYERLGFRPRPERSYVRLRKR